MLSGVPVNQGFASGSTGSHTHTTQNNIAQGDVIVIASTALGFTATVTSITDPAGNTYTKVLSGTGGTNPILEVFRCISKAAMAAGAVFTISYAVTTQAHATAMVSVPSMAANGLDDVELVPSTSSTTNSPTLTSGTLVNREELVFGFYTSHGNPGALTPASGFTTIVTGQFNAPNETLQIDYQLVSSTSPVTYNPGSANSILCRIGLYSIIPATPQFDQFSDGTFPRGFKFPAARQFQDTNPGIAPTPIIIPIFPPPVYPERVIPPSRFLTKDQWQDVKEELPVPNPAAPTADFMAFFDIPPRTVVPRSGNRIFYDTSSENDFNIPLPPAPTADFMSVFPDRTYPFPIPGRVNREFHFDPLVPSNTPGPVFLLGFYNNATSVSSTTRACTTLYDMFPGDSIIIVTTDGALGTNVSSVSDSVGNTYVVDDNATPASGPESGLAHCTVTTFLPKGSTITASFAGTNQNHTIVAIGVSGATYNLVSSSFVDVNPASVAGTSATSTTAISSGTLKEGVELLIYTLGVSAAVVSNVVMSGGSINQATTTLQFGRSSTIQTYVGWEITSGTGAQSLSSTWTTAASYREYIHGYRLVPKEDAWGVQGVEDYVIRRIPDLAKQNYYWDVDVQVVPIPILAPDEWQTNPPRLPPNRNAYQYYFEGIPPPFSTGVGPPLGVDPTAPHSMWKLMHPGRVRWQCWYPPYGLDEVLPIPTPQSVATEVDYSWYMARFYPRTRMPYPWFLDWESREVLSIPNAPFVPASFDYQHWRRIMVRS